MAEAEPKDLGSREYLVSIDDAPSIIVSDCGTPEDAVRIMAARIWNADPLGRWNNELLIRTTHNRSGRIRLFRVTVPYLHFPIAEIESFKIEDP